MLSYDIFGEFSEELEQKIISADSPSDSYAFCFCYRNKPVDISKHQEIIINKKSAKYAYYFAGNIVGADKERLKQVIIGQRSTYWVAQYFRYVDQDIMDMVKATGDNEYIALCLADITNCG